VGEAYGLAALVLALAGTGWLATIALFKRKPPNPNEGGTWRLTQETVAARSGSLVRVLLVREHGGRETGRLVIREIPSDAPNWSGLYTDAIATAEMRLAQLESAERH
jgi:hypothetical protein